MQAPNKDNSQKQLQIVFVSKFMRHKTGGSDTGSESCMLRMRSAKRLNMFVPNWRLVKLPRRCAALQSVQPPSLLGVVSEPPPALLPLALPKARRKRLVSLTDDSEARSQMQRNF